SARAAAIVGGSDDRPATAVQLSMAPRRLRDHSRRSVELAVGASLLVSMALLGRGHALAAASLHPEHALHVQARLLLLAAWIFYLRWGLLLQRLLSAGGRSPLRGRRREASRRWREAWLAHHLQLFDALRVLCALGLVSAVALIPNVAWSRTSGPAAALTT